MAGLVVMCAAFVVAGIDGGSVMVMSDSVSPSFGSDQQSWATDCVFSANRTRILQFSLQQKSVGARTGRADINLPPPERRKIAGGREMIAC